MYNPSTEQGKDAYNEWVILHNTANFPIDVSGWTLGGDRLIGDFGHGNGTTVIPSHGFAIVTDLNTQVYEHFMVNSSFVRLQVDDEAITRYGLNNKGDTIVVRDSSGNVVNEVSYKPSWGGNGNGHTIVEKNGEWKESDKIGGGLWSPGKVEIENNIYSWSTESAKYHVPYYSIIFNVSGNGDIWDVYVIAKEQGEEWYNESTYVLINGNEETDYMSTKKYTFDKKELPYNKAYATDNGHWPQGWNTYAMVDPYKSYTIKVYAVNDQTNENYTGYFNVAPLNKDSDGDGLSDAEESKYYNKWYPGINPNNPDTDGDHYTDGQEIIKYHTNPSNWDTDGDGASDADDINPLIDSVIYVTIYRIMAYDPVDSGGEGEADFQLGVRYSYTPLSDSSPDWSQWFKTPISWNKNDIYPHWIITINIDDSLQHLDHGKFVYLQFSLRDIDSDNDWVHAEWCDISKDSGGANGGSGDWDGVTLEIKYDVLNGTWTGDDSPSDNALGYASGNEDGSTGWLDDENDCGIWFKVSMNDNDRDNLSYRWEFKHGTDPFSYTRKWLYMGYLDGDWELNGIGGGSYARADVIDELEYVGNSTFVDFVVQLDSYPGQDPGWADTKRYYILKDYNPGIHSKLMADLGEVNMGDPQSLIDFELWAIANDPLANTYILDLWDHGGGVLGGCCQDITNNDHLTMSDLKYSSMKIYNSIGKKIDILLFDDCLMQMVEVAYQLRDTVKIIVGSEESMWFNFPYKEFAQYIVNNPQVSIEDLSSNIVQEYIESCEDNNLPEGTISALSMIKIGDVATAISSFANALKNTINEYISQIKNARQNTEHFDNENYIDIYDFARRIKEELGSGSVVEYAQELMDTLNDALIAEGHLDGHPNAYGLSIYFPLNSAEYDESYPNNDFAIDTLWNEFLEAYYSAGGG